MYADEYIFQSLCIILMILYVEKITFFPLYLTGFFQTNFQWMQVNVLKFTPSKLTYCPLSLTYNGQTLSEEDVIKFLGLHLDRHLSWETHLNSLLSKLGTVCFIMRKLSHVLNIESLKSCLFCSLSVCNSLWFSFLRDSHQFEKGILASKKDNKDYVRARA
jgi:hypothetical protein